MGTTYIGIDPGSKGYITVIHPDRTMEHFSIVGHTMDEVSSFLCAKNLEYENIVAVMEEIHAVQGSAAKATFSFGEIFGILKGLLIAHRIPYSLVPPRTWQNAIWIHSDKVFKATQSGRQMVDPKPTSRNAALRLFPGKDFRRTPQCKTPDDNFIDSLLIAEYARRMNF